MLFTRQLSLNREIILEDKEITLQKEFSCITILTFVFKGKKKTKSDSLIQRTYHPTICAWHPGRNLLAVGWENGKEISYICL